MNFWSLTSQRLTAPPLGLGLLQILCAPSCTLTSLDLSFNDMGPEGAGYVATALTRNRSLTQLNVRSVNQQRDHTRASHEDTTPDTTASRSGAHTTVLCLLQV